MCSPEGGSLKDVSMRVFPNLRRTQEYRNLPLWKQLCFYFLCSFSFHRKEIFPWECGNILNWVSSPGIIPRVLLLGEIPQNTQK